MQNFFNLGRRTLNNSTSPRFIDTLDPTPSLAEKHFSVNLKPTTGTVDDFAFCFTFTRIEGVQQTEPRVSSTFFSPDTGKTKTQTRHFSGERTSRLVDHAASALKKMMKF